MPDAILTVQDLQVRRGEQTVLQVSSLDIHQGEVLAVIGPNGAGKSTLLLVLARLLDPQQGQVTFRGSPIEGENDLVYRRRIALVLQEPLLIPAVSGGESLNFNEVYACPQARHAKSTWSGIGLKCPRCGDGHVIGM